MKALVKKEAREGIWLEEVPEPRVDINDVLIKVKRTAICGTDSRSFNGLSCPVSIIRDHVLIGQRSGCSCDKQSRVLEQSF